jgi:hypothetical protein
LSSSSVILLFALLLAACSSGGSSSSGISTASVSLSGITAVNYQPGCAIQTSLSTTASTKGLYFDFPSDAADQSGTITLSAIVESDLPVGLQSSSLRFQAKPANVFIYAFSMTSPDGQITGFDDPVTLSGTLSSTIPEGTVLNLAILENTTRVDIATANGGANGTFVQNAPSASLPASWLSEPMYYINRGIAIPG